jgi:dolichol-phosphate mannosyltransferase
VSTAWVVIPTYDEAANVERIVRAALGALAPVQGVEPHVLVVDDGSPDGTGRIADRLSAELPTVHVLHRTAKEGLGRAYLAGFAHALEHGADFVFEMDADFSHDPAALPSLVAAARDGADLAIGSRYVRGGRIEGWGFGRRMLSRGGCLYAQAVLTAPVRDLTGGFKCFRRATLERIGLGSVRSNGYVFQIEMTYRTLVTGHTVREVPITFRERDAGASKMTPGIAVEAVWKVPSLRLLHARGQLEPA